MLGSGARAGADVVVGDVCVSSTVDVPPHPVVSATLTSVITRPVPNRPRNRPDQENKISRAARRITYGFPQRGRFSVGLVVQIIASPLLAHSEVPLG